MQKGWSDDRGAVVNYEFEKVTEGVYALAVYDPSWESYNNCYIVVQDHDVLLIDCGKAEHSSVLVQALSQLGATPQDVTTLMATHGHHDHVGGSTALPNATKLIHINDYEILSPELQAQFSPALPDDGRVLDFECVLLGHHTRGSVALFHPKTRTLFVGDHLAFFRDPLPPEGLVSRGLEVRELAYSFVAQLAKSPKDRQRQRFENFGQFLQGLVTMQRFNAEAFCTGHGAVLYGNIASFMSELVRAADGVR